MTLRMCFLARLFGCLFVLYLFVEVSHAASIEVATCSSPTCLGRPPLGKPRLVSGPRALVRCTDPSLVGAPSLFRKACGYTSRKLSSVFSHVSVVLPVRHFVPLRMRGTARATPSPCDIARLARGGGGLPPPTYLRAGKIYTDKSTTNLPRTPAGLRPDQCRSICLQSAVGSACRVGAYLSRVPRLRPDQCRSISLLLTISGGILWSGDSGPRYIWDPMCARDTRDPGQPGA